MRWSLAIVSTALFMVTPAFAQESTVTPLTPATSTPASAPTKDADGDDEEEDVPPLALPTPVTPPPRPNRLFGSFEVSYSAQSLYGTLINGADFTGLIGSDRGSWSIALEVQAAPGRTVDGLDTFTFSLGPTAEGIFGRFRVGGGLRVGAFNVDRITTSGSLFTLTAGVLARLSVDVIQLDGAGNRALFVIAKGGVDSVILAPLYGGTLGVGLRF